jgi:hypothetical protein
MRFDALQFRGELWLAPLVWNLRANLPSDSARAMIAST